MKRYGDWQSGTLHSRPDSSWNSLGTIKSLSPKVNTPNAPVQHVECVLLQPSQLPPPPFRPDPVNHRFFGVMVTD